MPLSVLALNGRFKSSGERHVDILVHLVQRFENLVDVSASAGPCLVGRFQVLNVAMSQGHGEGVP